MRTRKNSASLNIKIGLNGMYFQIKNMILLRIKDINFFKVFLTLNQIAGLYALRIKTAKIVHILNIYKICGDSNVINSVQI